MNARRCIGSFAPVALATGRVLLVAGLVALAPRLHAQQPAAAKSQSTSCILDEQPSTRISADSIPGVGRVAYVGGGVIIRCPSRGIVMRGDSAEQKPDGDHLIGHAVYDEPRFHVTSDFLNYYPTDERIVAVGNVNARLPSGSTLVGPIAEYKRAVPRVRAQAQMEARARSTITMIEKDSSGKPVPPTTVVAEHVFMNGDSLIYANGQVVITRPEVTATADSVFMDETHETMRLMREPELKGKKERPFTLKGDLIDLYSKDKKLMRVIARANAVAVSDSMTLKSDTIDLRVRNDLLDHAYAWGGKSRATAISPTQHLVADSLDVFMPNQKVQLVRALRRAMAEGKPDTTRFRVDKPDLTDWLRGDTIIANFDSVAAKDTAKSPAISKLAASGHASSQYHVAASDTAERRPAISYIQAARIITIHFDKQKVSQVAAVDSVAGLYLEPRADTTSRKAPAANAKASGNTKAQPKPTSIIPFPPKKP